MQEIKTKDSVAKLDAGLRHKSGAAGGEFVEHYCQVFSGHAYATNDDSWNELEKTITHVLGMYIYWKRAAEILGLPTDPRSFVNEFEDASEQLTLREKQASREFLEAMLASVNHHDPAGAVEKMYSDGL